MTRYHYYTKRTLTNNDYHFNLINKACITSFSFISLGTCRQALWNGRTTPGGSTCCFISRRSSWRQRVRNTSRMLCPRSETIATQTISFCRLWASHTIRHKDWQLLLLWPELSPQQFRMKQFRLFKGVFTTESPHRTKVHVFWFILLHSVSFALVSHCSYASALKGQTWVLLSSYIWAVSPNTWHWLVCKEFPW